MKHNVEEAIVETVGRRGTLLRRRGQKGVTVTHLKEGLVRGGHCS